MAVENTRIKLTNEKLSDWVSHLQDNDSTGAWVDEDSFMFQQILADYEIVERIRYFYKTAKENNQSISKLYETILGEQKK